MFYPATMNDLTRRIIRILLLALAGTLLLTALAQSDRSWQDSFAAIVADESNGVLFDCAEELGPDGADYSCFELGYGLDTARVAVASALAGFGDVYPVNAWERFEGGSGVGRIYVVESDDGTVYAYLVGITESWDDRFTSWVLVDHYGTFDQDGNQLD